jgi:hypothetical protein
MRDLVLALCLLLPLTALAQDEFWCWDADEVLAEVVGDSIRVSHLNDLINCCPDPITFEVVVGDATILVEEHSLDLCDCYCCYHVEVTVADVPPGPWNVLYRWFDIETMDWAERVLEVVVPDVGQPPTPHVARQSSSGCLESATVPQTTEPSSWGTIKALYH